MSESSKAKSESEWRAVLSPEQVSTLPTPDFCINLTAYCSLYTPPNSFVFSAKKAPRLEGPANTNISKMKAYSTAPDVGRHCIRAPRSSIVDVDGLHFSMVCGLHRLDLSGCVVVLRSVLEFKAGRLIGLGSDTWCCD